MNFDLSFNVDVAPLSRNQGALLGSQPEPIKSIQLQTNCSSCAAREENHRRTGPAFLSGLSAIATEVRKHLIDDIERKQAVNYLLQPRFWSEVKVTTNDDDAASHSGGRDRRDGPTHAHGRL